MKTHTTIETLSESRQQVSEDPGVSSSADVLPVGAAVSICSLSDAILSAHRKGERVDHRIERRAGELRADLCVWFCAGVDSTIIRELAEGGGLVRLIELVKACGAKGVGHVG